MYHYLPAMVEIVVEVPVSVGIISVKIEISTYCSQRTAHYDVTG